MLKIITSQSECSVTEKNRSLMKWRNYKTKFKEMKATYEYQSSECTILRFYNKNILKSKWNSFLLSIDNSQYNKVKKLIIKGPVSTETYPTPIELYFLDDVQATLYIIFYEEFLNSLGIVDEQ